MPATATSSATSTWSLRIGRTDGDFLVGEESYYDEFGHKVYYEYTFLDYDAVVDVRLERKGESALYKWACSDVAVIVAHLVHTSLVVEFCVSDGTGMNFVSSGWSTPADALAILNRIVAESV